MNDKPLNFVLLSGAVDAIPKAPGDVRFSATEVNTVLIGGYGGLDVGDRLLINGESFVVVGADPTTRKTVVAPLAKGTLGRVEGMTIHGPAFDGVGVSCRKKAQWKREQQGRGRRR